MDVEISAPEFHVMNFPELSAILPPKVVLLLNVQAVDVLAPLPVTVAKVSVSVYEVI